MRIEESTGDATSQRNEGRWQSPVKVIERAANGINDGSGREIGKMVDERNDSTEIRLKRSRRGRKKRRRKGERKLVEINGRHRSPSKRPLLSERHCSLTLQPSINRAVDDRIVKSWFSRSRNEWNPRKKEIRCTKLEEALEHRRVLCIRCVQRYNFNLRIENCARRYILPEIRSSGKKFLKRSSHSIPCEAMKSRG